MSRPRSSTSQAAHLVAIEPEDWRSKYAYCDLLGANVLRYMERTLCHLCTGLLASEGFLWCQDQDLPPPRQLWWWLNPKIEGASIHIGICWLPTSLHIWKWHYVTFVLDCWHQKGVCDVKTKIFHLPGSSGGDWTRRLKEQVWLLVFAGRQRP